MVGAVEPDDTSDSESDATGALTAAQDDAAEADEETSSRKAGK